MPVGTTQSVITRCPACATAFRASAEQLAARNGQVRCGRCGRVFDAHANAVVVTASAPATEQTAGSPSHPVLDDTGAAGDGPQSALSSEPAFESSGPDEDETVRAAASDEPQYDVTSFIAEPLAERETHHAADGLPAGNEESAHPTEGAGADTWPEMEISAPDTHYESVHIELVDPDVSPDAPAGVVMDAGEGTADPTFIEQAATPEEPEAIGGEGSRELTAEQEQAPDEGTYEPAQADGIAPGGAAEAEQPQFADPEISPVPVSGLDSGDNSLLGSGDKPVAPLDFGRSKPKRARISPWLGVPLLLLLLLVLAGQVAYNQRAYLLQLFPAARPLAERLCARAGCDLPFPRHAELMSIEASDLEPDTANPSLMVLSATLRNRAPYAQARPALELTLTDLQDQALARRVLTPADYGGTPGAIFPGNSEQPVKVYFDASALKATGYRLYLFYP